MSQLKSMQLNWFTYFVYLIGDFTPHLTIFHLWGSGHDYAWWKLTIARGKPTTNTSINIFYKTRTDLVAPGVVFWPWWSLTRTWPEPSVHLQGQPGWTLRCGYSWRPPGSGRTACSKVGNPRNPTHSSPRDLSIIHKYSMMNKIDQSEDQRYWM